MDDDNWYALVESIETGVLLRILLFSDQQLQVCGASTAFFLWPTFSSILFLMTQRCALLRLVSRKNPHLLSPNSVIYTIWFSFVF